MRHRSRQKPWLHWLVCLGGMVVATFVVSGCRTTQTMHKVPVASPKMSRAMGKKKVAVREPKKSLKDRIQGALKEPNLRPGTGTNGNAQTISQAILLNGGANPQINFYSHVLYLQMMYRTLLQRALSKEQITIVSADGDDPRPDLLVQSSQRSSPLFYQRPEERMFVTTPRLINTKIQGKSLVPAKAKRLVRVVHSLANGSKSSKQPLLVFVTDHGTRNQRRRDGRNHFISLWKEDLSVQNYHRLLRPLGKRRVVSVMSQCFSGSFAWSVFPEPSKLSPPTGARCGFFATTHQRPAYGCFPETKLGRSVGHAYRFIQAMGQVERLDQAHLRVLLNDRTPDVPIRSSDTYLLALLRKYASTNNLSLEAAVDRWLRDSQTSYPEMQEELAWIGKLARRFGLLRPINMRALENQRQQLDKQLQWWRRVEQMWRQVFVTARDYHLRQWYRKVPALKRRVLWLLSHRYASLSSKTGMCLAQSNRVKKPSVWLSPWLEKVRGGHDIALRLHHGFRGYVGNQKGLSLRLSEMRKREKEMRAYSFWIEVQKAALLRMKYLFYRVAGRRMLIQQRERSWVAYREGLTRLLECESTRVGQVSTRRVVSKSARRVFAHPKPQPPSWFGISFLPWSHKSRLPRGAVVVRSVYLNTPAAVAGVRVGDIIYSIDGKELSEPYEIRERVMMATRERPFRLQVLRNGNKRDIAVRLRPQTSPPSLKLPPLLGRRVVDWKGLKALQEGVGFPKMEQSTSVVFFWATWCGPCKAALPILQTWKRKYEKRGLRVVTVSTESSKALNQWLQKTSFSLPFLNASDPQAFFSGTLGVRATPTFALLHQGQVRAYQVGAMRLAAFEQAIQKYLPSSP